jgi:hypothetical protein
MKSVDDGVDESPTLVLRARQDLLQILVSIRLNPPGHRNEHAQIDTLDPTWWDRTIAVNLTGVFNTVRETARERPLRREDQTGSKFTRPIRSSLCPEIGSEYRWRRVYHSI